MTIKPIVLRPFGVARRPWLESEQVQMPSFVVAVREILTSRFPALIGLLLLLNFVGCFRHRPVFEAAPAPIASESLAAPIQLDTVEADERQPIHHLLIDDINGGTPLGREKGASLRQISLDQVRQAAADHSAVANAIEKEMRQLRCKPELSECLTEIMQLQAMHERSVASGQAAESYLALAGVYLQHDLLVLSTEKLEATSKVIAKIKSADLPIEFDDRRLHREQNRLEEKAVELHYGQQRLTKVLELLIGADKSPTPIWTSWEVASLPELSIESELETAWQNRNDLKALDRIVECCGADLMQTIQSSARSLHPLLGLALSKKRLLQSRRRFKQQQDREACCQAEQIQGLIESRRSLIEEEITGLVLSIQKRKRLIELKNETIASLQASLNDAEKGAALKPVDLETQLANEAQILETRSAIIKEAIQLEIDLAKLRSAQGLIR